MRVLDLTFKDIKQIVRDWKSALFLVVMPILFTFFFGFVLGPLYSSDGGQDARLPVGVVDQDTGGVVDSALITMLDQSDVIRPTVLADTNLVQASQSVADGDLAAAVRIPAGYSDRLLSSQQADLEVVADQNIVAGQTASSALETVVNRLLGALESARLSADAFDQKVGFKTQAERSVLSGRGSGPGYFGLERSAPHCQGGAGVRFRPRPGEATNGA